MNEAKSKSELMALSMTTQYLIAVLGNKGVVDLAEMHDKLTDTVIHALKQPTYDGSELAKEVETAAVTFLDRLFSNATRTAAALRGSSI